MTKQTDRNSKKLASRVLIDRARILGFDTYEARERFKKLILKYGSK
jgi:hypothetical protein